jgi:hypothetical protein
LAVSLSELFEDGLALQRVAEQRGLEGVSKRRDAPIGPGSAEIWRKIKMAARRDANRERWRLFERTKHHVRVGLQFSLPRHAPYDRGLPS